jgi:hypothetical protein
METEPTSTDWPNVERRKMMRRETDALPSLHHLRIIAAVVVVTMFAIFGLITLQIDHLRDDQLQADKEAAAERVYRAELRTYDLEQDYFEDCLNRIDAREAVHRRLIASAETKRIIMDASTAGRERTPAIDAIYAAIDAEVNGVQTELPLLPRSTCPIEEPVPPVPPAHLQEKEN